MVMTYNRRVWINHRGEVANPAMIIRSWSAKQEYTYISPPPFAPENLVSRDGLGRPVPRQPAHSPDTFRLNLVLTYGIPPAFRGGILLFVPPTTIIIESVPSLSGDATAYRWRSRPRVCLHNRAVICQGSSSNSNGCCLFRYHHGPMNVRLSFPTPTYTIHIIGMYSGHDMTWHDMT